MIDLGLTVSEVLDLTPYQLVRLHKRWQSNRREQWRPFAMLASLYANAHPDPSKRREPFTPSDFMPADSQIAETPKADVDIWYSLKMWALAQPKTEIISQKNGSKT